MLCSNRGRNGPRARGTWCYCSRSRRRYRRIGRIRVRYHCYCHPKNSKRWQCHRNCCRCRRRSLRERPRNRSHCWKSVRYQRHKCLYCYSTLLWMPRPWLYSCYYHHTHTGSGCTRNKLIVPTPHHWAHANLLDIYPVHHWDWHCWKNTSSPPPQL